MTKHTYHIVERLRIAILLSFISGFINAFTFLTQNGRFAGIQTGNLISLSIYLARGNLQQVSNFLVPLLIFILGQFFSYIARKWCETFNLSWPTLSGILMLVIVSITAILTPHFSQFFTITSLTFVSSIQIDTFPKMHGLNYASVMMTGNIKNASFNLIKGIIEKDREILIASLRLFAILLTFSLAVLIATYLTKHFSENTLYFAIIPFLVLNLLLRNERVKQSEI